MIPVIRVLRPVHAAPGDIYDGSKEIPRECNGGASEGVSITLTSDRPERARKEISAATSPKATVSRKSFKSLFMSHDSQSYSVEQNVYASIFVETHAARHLREAHVGICGRRTAFF